MPLLLVELNEVNFDYLRAYAARGELPHLAGLMNEHGVAETTSEQEYDKLEPWIQWVTAHTGLSFSAHRVFRLGDIVDCDLIQIWEHLEAQGLRVGAMSPMNATNRLQDAAFFVPDPWTATSPSAPSLIRHLTAAVKQAVNDNAQARLALDSVLWLVAGAARYARPVNYGQYAGLFAAARTRPWNKAMFLDLLLTDLFIRETERTRPDFASLFLNAGAHIQHHYMFNSVAYRGEQQNPEWYVGRQQDPVFEIYKLYDRIIGEILRAFPESRVMVATGLHQDPHADVTFYWRIKNHAAFLSKLGIPFSRVEPRMSRDFLIECASDAEAAHAEHILRSCEGENGVKLFEVDNRGRDLFVTLAWSDDIPSDFVCSVGDDFFGGLRDDVAFVAIKNGEHNGVGYFLDTGASRSELPVQFPLEDLPARICRALGVDWVVDNRVSMTPFPESQTG